ncbi:MAG: hypothetical protein HY592_02450 [Candidatus Omnitrophica bacterium]|nr:hypothetical protein [Candidatus Omnitrophota bacterium]
MKRYTILVLAGLIAGSSVAYAETIRGMINTIDAARDMVGITRSDAAGTQPQEVNVKVTRDTKTKNVATLKDLQVGQEVKVDAKEDKAGGVWVAKTVEVTTPDAMSAPATAPTAG